MSSKIFFACFGNEIENNEFSVTTLDVETRVFSQEDDLIWGKRDVSYRQPIHGFGFISEANWLDIIFCQEDLKEEAL